MESPIKRMFITGVSPLTLSDVTSGFNIGNNFSLRADFNGMIGFTEDEVRIMLEYYRDATGVFRHSVEELLEKMKPWYNNNCFSEDCIDEQKLFNSDMALCFISNYIARSGKIPLQMIDSNVRSDYSKMRKMVGIDRSFGSKGQIMQQIIEDRGISGSLKPEFSIEDLLVPENLPSHLFYMGLLTYGLDKYGDPGFVIPNQVVYEQYFTYLGVCYGKCFSWYTDDSVMNSLGRIMVKEGNAQPLLEYLCNQITTDSSIRDFDPQAESFIKGFLLSKLGGSNNSCFITTTEREENHGYSDLYMEPWNDRCNHCFLIEIKYCRHASDDSEVQLKRKEAIDQLNRYSSDRELEKKAEGNGWTMHRLVVVFKGWSCQICEEII